MKNVILLNDADLKKYRLDSDFLKPIIQAILAKENIVSFTTKFFEHGSTIIVDIGNNMILKILPSFLKWDFDTELNALELLNKHKIEAVPKIYARGEIDNYYYIIMQKMPGMTLENVWHNMDFDNKISIMYSIGKFLQSIHAIPIDSTSRSHDWDRFLDLQIKNCEKHHLKNDLPDILVAQINKYLSHNLKMPRKNKKIVLLSGDVHYWNVLVEHKNGKYQISGFIDYGDSFYGEPEYDFLAPAYFMASGEDKPLLKHMFLGYGYLEEELNKELSLKMFAFQLIHRFSKLDKNIKNDDINALAQATWNFDLC